MNDTPHVRSESASQIFMYIGLLIGFVGPLYAAYLYVPTDLVKFAPYVLLVPFVAGLYSALLGGDEWDRESSPPLLMGIKAGSVLLAGLLIVPPMYIFLLGFVAVFGLKALYWLKTATWPESFSLQMLYPISQKEIATGFLGLDKIVWRLVAEEPIEALLASLFFLWPIAGLIPFAIKFLRRNAL